MKLSQYNQLLEVVKSTFPLSKRNKSGNIIINFPSVVGFLNIKGRELDFQLSRELVRHPDPSLNKILKEKFENLHREVSMHVAKAETYYSSIDMGTQLEMLSADLVAGNAQS